MLRIDALLPLYPDDTSRHAMLAQALTHVQADLDALRNAISNGDRQAALHHAHRAKGTASFLGGDQEALKHFDHLTLTLKRLPDTSAADASTASSAEMTDTSDTTAPVRKTTPRLASLTSALKPVESTLRNLESSLQDLVAQYQADRLGIAGGTSTPVQPEKS